MYECTIVYTVNSTNIHTVESNLSETAQPRITTFYSFIKDKLPSKNVPDTTTLGQVANYNQTL